MEDTPAAAAGSGSSRRTRTWGAEASRRTAMLHQLCAIRRGEIRASDAIQVKVDGLIYDTVPEEEYNALVARRRKEAGEFIIDNDGLGYIEDGHRTRTQGVEASLQRLRAVRSGEIRASDAVQVKVDAPIYDTVPEEEYNALVARRRKEAAEFIIDDDGLGYVEDWSHRRALPPQAKSASRRRSSNPSRRAAAAKTGAQQISSMFTSSVFIKRPGSDRAKSLPLAADSIVDAVIAEFAPDEDDREERRRRVGRLILAAEMVRSDNGNDMTVELKNDAEMETNLEEISRLGLVTRNFAKRNSSPFRFSF